MRRTVNKAFFSLRLVNNTIMIRPLLSPQLAHVLYFFEQEVQYLMFCKFLQAIRTKFLISEIIFCTDKCARQDNGIFHEIGNIEYQGTAPRLPVHDSKAMRYPQYPESDRSQAIGQIIAVIQEDVSFISRRSIMKADKIWYIDVFASIFIKCFRKDCLTCQQLLDIHGLPDDPLETMHSRLDFIVICIKAPALQVAIFLPDLLNELASLQLELLRRC